MKLRLLGALALTLALGGCATYGYVDEGGGYYRGQPSTSYRYYGDTGYPYYGYRPGASFGLSYGNPYYGYPYRGGYGYGYYNRPPVYHRPPPRPDGHRPGHGHDHDHDHDHDRPPVVDTRPPRPDRVPWRDLDRLRQQQGAGPDSRPSGATTRYRTVPESRPLSRGTGSQAPATGIGLARRADMTAPRPVQARPVQARPMSQAPRSESRRQSAPAASRPSSSRSMNRTQDER